jgi:hypothetical protein
MGNKTANSKKTATVATAVAETAKAEATKPQSTILFTEAGKLGVATAYRTEGEFETNISIKWSAKGKKALHTTGSHVDLRSMKAENLQEALAKVVHATGHLALFEIAEVKGRRSMVRVFLNEKTGNGYATLIRKGCKPFSFPLDRVDLVAMKAKTHKEAFEKAAWATGSVAVLPYADAAQSTETPAPEAVPAGSAA